MHLTLEQQAVTFHDCGHAKVIAVAGSGKTSTLIGHIDQLLSRDIDSRRILVLMYNKSAQMDFQQRINNRTTVNPAKLPEIRTFHSLGFRLYQSMVNQGALPSPKSWKPMTSGQIDGHISRLLRQHAPKSVVDSLGSAEFKEQLIEPMLAFMAFCNSQLESPQEVFEQLDLGSEYRYFIDVFQAFENFRKQTGSITFSDMLCTPLAAMKGNPSLAQKFSNHMDHILVDEYQDIDDVQAELLSIIAGKRAKVMIIGDPDQSIYGFRGAAIEHILYRFDDRFNDAKQFPISHTHRYGPQLALLANHLIANNQQRTGMLTVSAPSTSDTDIHFSACDDEEKQIIRSIESYQSRGIALNDMAIVVRLWAQAVNIELELLENNIPYTTASPYSVLKRDEINTLALFLQWPTIGELEASQRERYLTAAFHFPRLKIKQQQLTKATRALAEQWSDDRPAATLKNRGFSHWEVTQISERLQLLERLHRKSTDAGKLISAYADATDLMTWLEDNATTSEGGVQRVDLVATFINYCQRQRLPPTAMAQHLLDLKTNRQLADKNSVAISSIHKAKGLEWAVVFIPGMSKKYAPYLPKKRLSSSDGIESERRLTYVAMTRAREHLHLYAPTKNGSPFIDEMQFDISKKYGKIFSKSSPKSTIDVSKLPLATPVVRQYAATLKLEILGAPVENSRPQVAATKEKSQLNIGRHLRHKTFGSGRVTGKPDGKFIVKFESGKTVTFPLSSANKYFFSH